jgi:Trp operon repressor
MKVLTSVVYSRYGLDPHCDVMNDWRDGYNFITVLKSTFYDDEVDDLVTISLICYTRKAISDRLSAISQIFYNK